MIQRSDIKTASFDVRQRARATHAYERGDHVLIAPFDESKALRTVVFFQDGRVLCVNATTGEQCEANSFGNVCYHSFSAGRRKDINAKRRATLRAKKQGVRAA